MRISLLQLDVSLSDPMGERLARVREQILDCAGADLVLLPELWAHGAWAEASWEYTAEGLSGPVVTMLGEAARAAGVVLHGGSIVERDRDRLFNTAVLLGPDGGLLAMYRKIHRFGFDVGEAARLHAGTDLVTAPICGLSAGVATCYDLRFPEQFRELSAAGAQMFLLSASWPALRVEHWRLLTRARAVENLAYVVAVGASGMQAGIEQAGHSVVVDPWGTVLAEAGSQACRLDVEIDPAAVAAVRAEFPALRDRRL